MCDKGLLKISRFIMPHRVTGIGLQELLPVGSKDLIELTKAQQEGNERDQQGSIMKGELYLMKDGIDGSTREHSQRPLQPQSC